MNQSTSNRNPTWEPHDKKMDDKATESCPYIITKQAGDESYDLCEISERVSGSTRGCLIEHGLYECDTWEEIKKEQEDE